MQKITTAEELKNTIQQLEYKQALEWVLLKEQFLTTCESLKPLNVIKNTFKEFTTSPDIKNKILDTAIGLATGYLSKALMVGSSHNPLKKIVGAFLQIGISNVVSKNAETIKSFLKKIVDKHDNSEKI